MRFLTALTLGIAVFGLSSAARAEVVTYHFDKAHTQILFFVNHLGYAKSQGEFHDYDGQLVIDHANPANSNVNVTIKTASIDMDDQPWNDHMKNADFFNVEKFPDMTFQSTNVEVTGENTAKVTGDLTLLGVTKPVVLNVTHNKSDVHPYSGKPHTGFSATAMLKRSDFGMNYGLPAVGDEVEIRIEVEAEQAQAEAVNQ